MQTATSTKAAAPVHPAMHGGNGFELRFESLFKQGRALSFPCDASGNVSMDSLSEHELTNYLYARGMLGHDYQFPTVVATTR